VNWTAQEYQSTSDAAMQWVYANVPTLTTEAQSSNRLTSIGANGTTASIDFGTSPSSSAMFTWDSLGGDEPIVIQRAELSDGRTVNFAPGATQALIEQTIQRMNAQAEEQRRLRRRDEQARMQLAAHAAELDRRDDELRRQLVEDAGLTRQDAENMTEEVNAFINGLSYGGTTNIE
jgi:hypothetical protein